jgi:hypothetical protein
MTQVGHVVDSCEHGDELSSSIKLNPAALVRKQTIPTEQSPLVGEVSSTFADRRYPVVSVTDPHGR